MRKKWSVIQEDPDAYEERTPAVTWPTPTAPSQRTEENTNL
jgi:hypothetical protein